MAKLYFKYGAMNSSKSAQLIMTAYNYQQSGKRTITLKPSIDTRGEQGYIESRATSSKIKAIEVSLKINLFELIESLNTEEIHAVLIDEAQFLTATQVRQLVKIVEVLKINVICFGLKNTYKEGELFEGSAMLLYYADSLTEIKNVCQFCNKKATMNLRVVNGKRVYRGETVQIGDMHQGDEYFIQVCRKHYLEHNMNLLDAHNN